MTFSMTRFPQNAGIASGLTGGLTFLMVSALSYTIVNFLPAQDGRNLGFSYLSLVLPAIAVLFLAKKSSKESNQPAMA